MLKQIKLFLVSALALVAYGQIASADIPSFKLDHYLLNDACATVLNEQISWELYASVTYLNMAGYFDRPSVARQGFAKFFKDQSKEEYDHASQFIDYVNKRNGTVKRIAVDESPKSFWAGPKEALSDAITLEKQVYSKLRYIHEVADQKCQDPHLMDFLESYFFTEQVDSIQELQTMLSTLSVEDSSAAAVIEHIENNKLKKGHKEL